MFWSAAGPIGGPTARNFKKLEVQPRVARRANSIMPESIDLDEEADEMGATILDPQTQTQLTQGGDQGMESEVGGRRCETSCCDPAIPT